MKKLILAAFALTTAASVIAQGTINFNDTISATSLRAHIYAPAATATGLSQIGNGATDGPAGSTVWTGFNLIGASGTAGQYGGGTTLASLLAAPGTTALEASLAPGLCLGGLYTTTFKTGGGAGFNNGVGATFNNIARDYTGGFTWEMVVWDDSATKAGYDLNTWGTVGSKNAYDAWQAGLIAAGTSGVFRSTATVGGSSALAPNLTGLQSFNLYIIPEPSTFALAGLGAAALLIFRRRK